MVISGGDSSDPCGGPTVSSVGRQGVTVGRRGGEERGNRGTKNLRTATGMEGGEPRNPEGRREGQGFWLRCAQPGAIGNQTTE